MKLKTAVILLFSAFVLVCGILYGIKRCNRQETASKDNCSSCTAALAGTCSEAAGTVTAADTSRTSQVNHKIIAYYFYTTIRCASCYKIENYSKEAIQKNFADALQSGKLEWQMLNVDEEANKHFVDDYSLFTKSLVLVDMVDGKQTRWKNCGKVWELLSNKEAFESYVQKEVQSYLEPTNG